jgi:tetratricopeptide (TPR) repeat protein
MNSIDKFSEYIAELAREKKYENVLIGFRNNVSDFEKSQIKSNVSIVKNVITAYANTKAFDEAISFLKEFDIIIDQTQNRAIISAWLWLLYYQISYIVDQGKTVELVSAVESISAIIETVGPNDDYYDMVIVNVLRKTSKGDSPQTSIDLCARVLKAAKFRANKRLRDAVKADSFLVVAIAGLFGKIGHPERGFTFLRLLDIDVFSEGIGIELLNRYGWLLYYAIKKNNKALDDEKPDDDLDTIVIEFENAGSEGKEEVFFDKEKVESDVIRLLPKLSTDDKYSPFSRLFNLFLKVEKQKPNTNWKKVLELLRSVDVDKLSLDCKVVEFEKNGRLKKAELASDKEIWYSFMCNGLFHLEEYEKCMEFLNSAFEAIPKFHYNNDIWLSRRLAQCKRELGDINQAIQGLEKILQKRSEWFIQKDIAELYLEKGDTVKSKALAIAAALNRDEREKKDGLFLLLGKIFLKGEDKTTAYKHFLLALLIRQELQFRIPNELKELLTATKPENENLQFENSNTLYNHLRGIWQGINKSHTSSQGNIQSGKIIRLIEAKRIGFISGDDNIEYFFRFKDYRGRQLRSGQKVRFKIQKPDSPEKNWIAFDIQ